MNPRNPLNKFAARRGLIGLIVLTTCIQPRAHAEPSEAGQELGASWKGHKEEMAGWQDERKGATWSQYLSNQPDDADKLLMPKTVEAVIQLNQWFGLDLVKSAAEENKNDADVKS